MWNTDEGKTCPLNHQRKPSVVRKRDTIIDSDPGTTATGGTQTLGHK
jgi:hypothetical protein